VEQRGYFTLEFGLPEQPVREMIQRCLKTGNRVGPEVVAAVNRIGRSIGASVTCTPLSGSAAGVVLLMDEVKAG
jgi:two-component system CheB/CheR fusion protein